MLIPEDRTSLGEQEGKLFGPQHLLLKLGSCGFLLDRLKFRGVDKIAYNLALFLLLHLRELDFGDCRRVGIAWIAIDENISPAAVAMQIKDRVYSPALS